MLRTRNITMRKFIHYDYLRRAFYSFHIKLIKYLSFILYFFQRNFSKSAIASSVSFLPCVSIKPITISIPSFSFPLHQRAFYNFFLRLELLLHITLTFRDFADEYILNIPLAFAFETSVHNHLHTK